MSNTKKPKLTTEEKAVIKSLEQERASIVKMVKEFEGQQKFPMDSECLDKQGNSTKVLTVDVDREGIFGLYVDLGNPYTITKEGTIEEDKKILSAYLNFMSDIDLSKEENLKAIGWNIEKARELVQSFFMLRLASNLSGTGEQES